MHFIIHHPPIYTSLPGTVGTRVDLLRYPTRQGQQHTVNLALSVTGSLVSRFSQFWSGRGEETCLSTTRLVHSTARSPQLFGCRSELVGTASISLPNYFPTPYSTLSKIAYWLLAPFAFLAFCSFSLTGCPLLRGWLWCERHACL
jgi:hypothetical protein